MVFFKLALLPFFCHSLYVVFLRHQSMKAGKSMKKRFVSLLVALSITLTFLPIGAVAAAPIKFTDRNLKYTVNADGESVTVSGTSGKPKQLTIESSISDGNGKSYTVTKIGMGLLIARLRKLHCLLRWTKLKTVHSLNVPV